MGNLLLCEPIIQYDWIFTINWISHIKSNKYRHIVISKKLQTTPREHTPRTTKTSILQGFESICLCLMVCTIGLMGNDTELKSLFGIVFQHRVHRGCPGAASSCLTSHSNRPMAQENMHVPIVVTWPNFSGQRYMSTNRLVVILSEGMWNSWPLRRTVPWMFRPRSHLVRTSLTFAASQNQSKPVKTQPGEVLERLCNGLLLGLTTKKWRISWIPMGYI